MSDRIVSISPLPFLEATPMRLHNPHYTNPTLALAFAVPMNSVQYVVPGYQIWILAPFPVMIRLFWKSAPIMDPHVLVP